LSFRPEQKLTGAGMQYVVTAAVGHGSFGTKTGDYVIAYELTN
jgi:glucose dehydrogenase